MGDKMARQCLPCAMKATGTEIYYRAVPVEEGLPDYAQIVPVLIDGRLPMMAQLMPDILKDRQTWQELSSRKEITKGVTHWLKPMWVQSKHMDLMIGDLINEMSRDEELKAANVEVEATALEIRVLAKLIRERFIPRSYLITTKRQGGQ